MADSNSNMEKTYYFSMVLYPENPAHVRLLNYFEQFPYAYKLCYILHDKDIWTEDDIKENPDHRVGDPKKNHWHVIVRKNRQSTAPAFAKFCGLNYVECVHEPESLIHYFLHATPEAMEAGKHLYDASSLHGTPSLCKLGQGKNANFVQLGELATLIRHQGFKMDSLILYIAEHPEFEDTFNVYNYWIKAMIDERDRDEDREYRRTHPMDVHMV